MGEYVEPTNGYFFTLHLFSPFPISEFSNNAQYNAYKKRQKDNNFSIEEYEKQKEEKGDSFYRDADYLEYGQDSQARPQKVREMTKELHTLYASPPPFI